MVITKGRWKVSCPGCCVQSCESDQYPAISLTLFCLAFKTSLSLPGSKKDVVRTKLLQGPSPVGGASGGTESRSTTGLDEFELQAAHYNLACAYSQIGQVPEAIAALQTSLENGFDNFGTIRSDPDLAPLRSSPDFDKLMAAYEPSSGFNPFGLFGKK